MAVQFGLEAAHNGGFASLLVESDSLATVRALNGGLVVNPCHQLLVEDILLFLSCFSSIRCSFYFKKLQYVG